MSLLHGDSQWSVALMETVVSVQSDMEDVLVELPDGERGLLLRSRSRCEHQAVQTQWPSMLSQDFERRRAVLLKPRQFARSLRSNVDSPLVINIHLRETRSSFHVLVSFSSLRPCGVLSHARWSRWERDPCEEGGV